MAWSVSQRTEPNQVADAPLCELAIDAVEAGSPSSQRQMIGPIQLGLIMTVILDVTQCLVWRVT